MVKLAFGKLPEAIRSQTETPIETTLELLVRTLASREEPESLCGLYTVYQ